MVASNTLVLNLPLENVVTDVSKSPVSPTGSNMSYQAGKIGKGNLGNGSNGSVSCPNASKLQLTGEITACAWVKKGASGISGFLGPSKRVDAGNQNYNCFYLGGTTDVRIIEYNNSSGGGNNRWVPTSQSNFYNTCNDGSWHHIAFSFIYGTGSSLKCYLDGVDTAGSWTVGNGNSAPATSTDVVYVGRQGDSGSPSYVNYNFDEVYIFNKALGSSDIRRVMMGLPPLVG